MELGAGWIHNITDNPIYELAKAYGIKMQITHYDHAVARDEKGRDVTKDVHHSFKRLFEVREMTKALVKHKKTHMQEPDMSQQNALILNGWTAGSNQERSAEYIVYDFFYGMDNSNISLRFSFDYDPQHELGDDVRVIDPRGFHHIIKCLADVNNIYYPEDKRIHLSEVVTTVRYTNNNVVVNTSKGKRYKADYAILTFSLGVLQNEKVKFIPPLPVEKVERIHLLKMTNYVKVFVGFDEKIKPFWDVTEMILYCHNRIHYFTVWENLVYLGYNILIGTLMEEEADRVLHMSDDEMKIEVTAILRQMYGAHIPEPAWVKMTRWQSDPLFCGTFSGRPVGVSLEDMQVFIHSKPIFHVNQKFCGKLMIK